MMASGPSLQLLHCPEFGESGNEVGITFATAALAPSSIRLEAGTDVILGHDIVAREHGIGFVARDGACGLLRHTSPDHVAYARVPEVMKKQARDVRIRQGAKARVQGRRQNPREPSSRED